MNAFGRRWETRKSVAARRGPCADHAAGQCVSSEADGWEKQVPRGNRIDRREKREDWVCMCQSKRNRGRGLDERNCVVFCFFACLSAVTSRGRVPQNVSEDWVGRLQGEIREEWTAVGYDACLGGLWSRGEVMVEVEVEGEVTGSGGSSGTDRSW